MTYLVIDSALVNWLCSNQKGSAKYGAIPVKAPRWTLPAWWPIVTDDVPDEGLRPLTDAQRRRMQLAEYRSINRHRAAGEPPLSIHPKRPPRNYA